MSLKSFLKKVTPTRKAQKAINADRASKGLISFLAEHPARKAALTITDIDASNISAQVNTTMAALRIAAGYQGIRIAPIVISTGVTTNREITATSKLEDMENIEAQTLDKLAEFTAAEATINILAKKELEEAVINNETKKQEIIEQEKFTKLIYIAPLLLLIPIAVYIISRRK